MLFFARNTLWNEMYIALPQFLLFCCNFLGQQTHVILLLVLRVDTVIPHFVLVLLWHIVSIL